MKRNYFLVTVDYLDVASIYVSYTMLLALIDKASSHLVSVKILGRLSSDDCGFLNSVDMQRYHFIMSKLDKVTIL